MAETLRQHSRLCNGVISSKYRSRVCGTITGSVTALWTLKFRRRVAGTVADPAHPSSAARGNRRMFELLEGNDQLDATAIQTVGSKGYDGFVYALVR